MMIWHAIMLAMLAIAASIVLGIRVKSDAEVITDLDEDMN